MFFVTLALMLTLNATGVFPRDEVGALNLYLDFINMFMFLLQFLGNRE